MDVSFWTEVLGPDYKLKVFDIGAASGGYSPPYQDLVDLGIASVTGFEPDREQCESLNSNAPAHSKYIPSFIGSGGRATYYETNWVLTGSLYKPNEKLLGKFQNLSEVVTLIAEHSVETMSLDSLFQPGDAHFLKLDIQGGELDALRGGEKLLSEVMAIQVEVEFMELYENQPLFSDVDSYLRSQGFVFHSFDGDLSGRPFKPFVVNGNPNQRINQVLWSDARYVRNWMQISELSIEGLCNLALISAGIFRSPDLCHLVLLELDHRLATNWADKFLASVVPTAY